MITEVIKSVIEATKRIPDTLKNIKFFSYDDKWFYIEMGDDRVCLKCKRHSGKEYRGSEIRGMFPFLEIIGENTIHPHVHPNCRCIMIRSEWLIEPEEPIG